MKLDFEFVKQIFLLIEEESDYLASSHKLMKSLGIKSKQDERKFMGHIFLLADEKLIDSTPSSKYPFGFVFGVDGEYTILDVGYRITARGYEFIDIIKNHEIYSKTKNLSIGNALDISKMLLQKKSIDSSRKTIFG